MSYDLFSLTFVPRQEDRTIIDLVDPKGLSHYTKRRIQTSEYKIEVYGAFLEAGSYPGSVGGFRCDEC